MIKNLTNSTELIQNCIRGDRQSQKELYYLLCNNAYRICLKYCENKADAEDVLQEGFVKLFNKLHTFKGEGSFEGWVSRIFANTSIQHLRSIKLHTQLTPAYEEQIRCTASTALDNLYRKDIEKAVNQLSEGHGKVFKMYAMEGYNHKEIADFLGVSEVTSRSQLHRGKNALRKLVAV